MPVTRDMLLAELKELQRLTAFEQAVATVRRSQAATEAVGTELADNASRAGERLALLAQAVRGAGGTPDVVGPVLGRLGALVQTQVNQVQTLQGALLGDLALEHQLRERARYARTLAVTLGEMSVLPVLDRLDGAHTETIAWLERRLGEVARTGSSALKATPVQVAVGSVRRVALAPFAVAAEGVNRVGGLLGRFTRSAPAVADAGLSSVVDTVSSAAETVVDSASSAAETVADTASSAAETVADTASSAAETVADTASSTGETVAETVDAGADRVSGETWTGTSDVTASDAADAVGAAADTGQTPEAAAEQATHEALEASGGDDVPDAKPPFAGYERLSGDLVMRHVDDTEDVAELRTLLAFEQAHKARKGVLKAVQSRLTSLST